MEVGSEWGLKVTGVGIDELAFVLGEYTYNPINDTYSTPTGAQITFAKQTDKEGC
jgi:hypothetical protein